MTAREIGRLSLEDALALTALVADKDPRRLDAFAARWLSRYLAERAPVSPTEAAFVGAALGALREQRARAAARGALATLVAS